ncbi:MAG: hypothetical protein DSM106950_41720 [Stigonema ocellatum SAG 48.90 = DSM 106950]|nr:hypothetical protein [Stigonema ocellatum SAG 48.90 = DSM 106950]
MKETHFSPTPDSLLGLKPQAIPTPVFLKNTPLAAHHPLLITETRIPPLGHSPPPPLLLPVFLGTAPTTGISKIGVAESRYEL